MQITWKEVGAGIAGAGLTLSFQTLFHYLVGDSDGVEHREVGQIRNSVKNKHYRAFAYHFFQICLVASVVEELLVRKGVQGQVYKIFRSKMGHNGSALICSSFCIGSF